jgi:hypothetical protein
MKVASTLRVVAPRKHGLRGFTLGHASISTTADTYTDWDVRQLEPWLVETFAAEDEPPQR